MGARLPAAETTRVEHKWAGTDVPPPEARRPYCLLCDSPALERTVINETYDATVRDRVPTRCSNATCPAHRPADFDWLGYR